jgi:hypothetical protein
VPSAALSKISDDKLRKQPLVDSPVAGVNEMVAKSIKAAVHQSQMESDG